MSTRFLHRIAAIVARLPVWAVWALILAVMAVVGLIDYLTGSELSFSVFYLIPISMATLALGQPYGFLFSLMSAVAWFTLDVAQNTEYAHPLVPFWNASVRLMYFIMHTILLSSIFKILKHEREQASLDPLTNAANWRGLKESTLEQLRLARDGGQPVTFAYIDLDNFKAVNDANGHDAGDLALRTIVASIKGNVRSSDLVARVGGDEIVVMLMNSDYENSLRSLDRIAKHLGDQMAANAWPITFSIGAVTYDSPPQELDPIIKEVDQLMYAVKNSGKNAIRHERRT